MVPEENIFALSIISYPVYWYSRKTYSQFLSYLIQFICTRGKHIRTFYHILSSLLVLEKNIFALFIISYPVYWYSRKTYSHLLSYLIQFIGTRGKHIRTFHHILSSLFVLEENIFALFIISYRVYWYSRKTYSHFLSYLIQFICTRGKHIRTFYHILSSLLVLEKNIFALFIISYPVYLYSWKTYSHFLSYLIQFIGTRGKHIRTFYHILSSLLVLEENIFVFFIIFYPIYRYSRKTYSHFLSYLIQFIGTRGKHIRTFYHILSIKIFNSVTVFAY